MNHLHSTRRGDCRLCGSTSLSQVLALTPTPPANAFVGPEALNAEQPVFPLDVYFCDICSHVQLLDVVDPKILFENYVYVSGTSTQFVQHFTAYAKTIRDRFAPLDEDALVLDIGSNDGTLLAQFKNLGFRTLGVDPAVNIAEKATASGIETVTAFFTAEIARRILETRGPVKIITANNVFAHADDLVGIVEGVRTLLAPDGIFVFEVSYLVDVFEKTLFDTVYHEHLSYHAVVPLKKFLEANGLKLIAAERIDSHGGSLRAIAKRLGGPHPVEASVRECIALEREIGLDRAETLLGFGTKIDALKMKLKALLWKLKRENNSIAGFGAPAKATTLMYHFGIGPDIINYIVDDNPIKQGLFSPGMHIPVLPSKALYEKRPDCVVILAWNFSEAIIQNHSRYMEIGGRFVVPVPKVEIYPK